MMGAERISSAIVIASVLATTVCAQTFPQELPNVCGKYGNITECAEVGASTYQYQQLEMSGITSGGFELNRYLFLNSTDCSGTPSVKVDVTGTYRDIGYSTDKQDYARKLMINVVSWEITVGDQFGISEMNRSCNCGGKWEVGKARTLTNCAGDCDKYAQILGASQENGKGGVIIGQPVFALGKNNGSFFTLGRFDSIPGDAFANGIGENLAEPPQAIVMSMEECSSVEVSVQACGEFSSSCRPFINASAMVEGSILNEFTYSGITSGLYTKSTQFFSDGLCTKPRITVSEEGSMTIDGGAQPQENATTYAKFAANIEVIVQDQASLALVKANCPCGDASAWKMNSVRIITTCPPNSCISDFWYNNVTIGKKLYGTTRYTDLVSSTSTFDLQFSPPTVDENAPMQNEYPLNLNLAGEDYDTRSLACDYKPTSNVCGMWQTECSAMPGSMVAYDILSDILLTNGDADDGAVTLFDSYFTAGQGCTSQVLTVQGTGYYSLITGNGGQQGILLQIRSMQVTPYDGMAKSLNNDCPCGQTNAWKDDQPRLITKCPAGTCSVGASLFGHGVEPGYPRYGRIQRLNKVLQVSRGMFNSSVGLAIPFLADDTPFDVVDECAPLVPNVDICGNWTQPCNNDDTYDDFMVSFEFWKGSETNGGDYAMQRDDFAVGQGCDGGPILTVAQAGNIKFTKAKTVNIPNGESVELDPEYMDVTPKSAKIVTALNTKCPCGGTWSLGATRRISAPCPDNCDYTWVRQPLGMKSYGVLRRFGNDPYASEMRMTSFSPDANTGYSQEFTVHDYGYIMSHKCDKTPVVPPSGPATAKGLSGGDTFLLIFFISAFCYIFLGMTVNYMRSGGRNGGVPTIPNIDFWRSLPGLVADGISFCMSCGKTSGGYGRF